MPSRKFISRLGKLIFHSATLVCFSISTPSSWAQKNPAFPVNGSEYQPISLQDFVKEISENNASIQMKRIGVKTATAGVEQAAAPILNPIVTYARGSIYTQSPYTGYTNPASNTLGASITIEGVGKRTARENFAKAEENRITSETITDSKVIETQAIFSYIDALRTKLLWQSNQSGIENLVKIKSAASIDKQSEFKSAQDTLSNDLKFFSYDLINYTGKLENKLPLPIGNLKTPAHNFNVDGLIQDALAKRTELNSTLASIESAKANIELIKKSKNIDVNPGIYYTQTPSYNAGGVNYGPQQSFSFLISIPIANNIFYDSDVVQAVNNQAQQEINLQATKTKIITEINQTFLQYQSANEKFLAAKKSYEDALNTKIQNVQSIANLRDKEYDLIDARTAQVKTSILLMRLSGDFSVPNLE